MLSVPSQYSSLRFACNLRTSFSTSPTIYLLYVSNSPLQRHVIAEADGQRHCTISKMRSIFKLAWALDRYKQMNIPCLSFLTTLENCPSWGPRCLWDLESLFLHVAFPLDYAVPLPGLLPSLFPGQTNFCFWSPLSLPLGGVCSQCLSICLTSFFITFSLILVQLPQLTEVLNPMTRCLVISSPEFRLGKTGLLCATAISLSKDVLLKWATMNI